VYLFGNVHHVSTGECSTPRACVLAQGSIRCRELKKNRAMAVFVVLYICHSSWRWWMDPKWCRRLDLGRAVEHVAMRPAIQEWECLVVPRVYSKRISRHTYDELLIRWMWRSFVSRAISNPSVGPQRAVTREGQPDVAPEAPHGSHDGALVKFRQHS